MKISETNNGGGTTHWSLEASPIVVVACWGVVMASLTLTAYAILAWADVLWLASGKPRWPL